MASIHRRAPAAERQTRESDEHRGGEAQGNHLHLFFIAIIISRRRRPPPPLTRRR